MGSQLGLRSTGHDAVEHEGLVTAMGMLKPSTTDTS